MKAFKERSLKIYWDQFWVFTYDLDSFFKSVWIGWWLITWCNEPRKFSEFNISFHPTGD